MGVVAVGSSGSPGGIGVVAVVVAVVVVVGVAPVLGVGFGIVVLVVGGLLLLGARIVGTGVVLWVVVAVAVVAIAACAASVVVVGVVFGFGFRVVGVVVLGVPGRPRGFGCVWSCGFSWEVVAVVVVGVVLGVVRFGFVVVELVLVGFQCAEVSLLRQESR